MLSSGKSKKPRRILILKPSALGDIAHALPVLPALRKALPEAHIAWLVRKEFAPLLKCVDGLDEIIHFDRKTLSSWWYNPRTAGQLWRFLRHLKSGRYDLVLDLQGLFRTALFGWFTRCGNRVGIAHAREGATLFYTHKVLPPKDSIHLIDLYRTILDEVEISMESIRVDFTIPQSANQHIEQLLRNARVETAKLAVLVPGSAHQSKCWPVDRFAKLAEYLHTQKGFAVAAIGTHCEIPQVEQIIQAASVPIANLAGKTNIPQLMALFQRTSIVISNDTGPGYIADALWIPTLIIFGHTNPARVGPYGKPNAIAAIDPENRTKTIEDHRPQYQIANVPIELIIEKIERLLDSNLANSGNVK